MSYNNSDNNYNIIINNNCDNVLILGASKVSTSRVCDACHKNISDLHWRQCTSCKLLDLHDTVEGIRNACTLEDSSNRYKTKCTHAEVAPIRYEESELKHERGEYQEHYRYLIAQSTPINDDADANTLLKGIHDDVVNQANHPSLRCAVEIAALKMLKYMATPTCRKILCLDGGGVRGYFTLLVLQTVIERMFGKSQDDKGSNKEGFLTSLDHPQWQFVRCFDIVSGTSTGGLIAFCLSVGYSIYSLKEVYTNFSHYFKRGWVSSVTRVPLFGAKYNPTNIDNKIAEIVGNAWENFVSSYGVPAPTEKKSGCEITLRDYDDMSKILLSTKGVALPLLIISAYDLTKSCIKLFHSKFTCHKSYALAEVLAATKAAPTYFPAVKIRVPGDDCNPYHFFVDGGLFANDPSLSVLLLESMGNNNKTYVIVSIGTAATTQTVNITPTGGYLSWVLPNPVEWLFNRFRSKVNKTTDSSGLLIETFMQANAALTEAFVANLNPHKVRRFKFNCFMPEPMALDDATFVSKIDAQFRAEDAVGCCLNIAYCPDMCSLLSFFERYVKEEYATRSQPQLGIILKTNPQFSECLDEIIKEKVEKVRSTGDGDLYTPCSGHAEM